MNGWGDCNFWIYDLVDIEFEWFLNVFDVVGESELNLDCFVVGIFFLFYFMFFKVYCLIDELELSVKYD